MKGARSRRYLDQIVEDVQKYRCAAHGGGNHGEIWSPEKNEILYGMNKDNSELMKNEMSLNIFEEIIGFDASCKKRVEQR